MFSLATQYLLEETKEIYLCMALYELIFLKNFRIFIGYDIFSNYITSRKISNYALPYSKKIKLQKCWDLSYGPINSSEQSFPGTKSNI